MSRPMRDGTAELVSRDQILRHEQRGEREIKIHFPCSADHVQNWQNLTRLIHTLAICVTIHIVKPCEPLSAFRFFLFFVLSFLVPPRGTENLHKSVHLICSLYS